jgi:hypothetical protein
MKVHPKGKLAVALSLKEDKDRIWNVFWALNQLRNKIAHNVEPILPTDKESAISLSVAVLLRSMACCDL